MCWETCLFLIFNLTPPAQVEFFLVNPRVFFQHCLRLKKFWNGVISSLVRSFVFVRSVTWVNWLLLYKGHLTSVSSFPLSEATQNKYIPLLNIFSFSKNMVTLAPYHKDEQPPYLSDRRRYGYFSYWISAHFSCCVRLFWDLLLYIVHRSVHVC